MNTYSVAKAVQSVYMWEIRHVFAGGTADSCQAP